MNAILGKVNGFLDSAWLWIKDSWSWFIGFFGEWMGKFGDWFLPIWDELEDITFFYPGFIILGIAAFIGWAVWSAWAANRKYSDSDLTDDLAKSLAYHPLGTVVRWAAKVFYIFDIFYAIMILTAEGNPIYRDVFFPMNAEASFYGFTGWHQLLQYAVMFVVIRFALTVVFSVLRLKFLHLIRFLLLTFGCIALGVLGGFLLTVLNNFTNESILGTVISIPVYFIVYMVPFIVLWIPLGVPALLLVRWILAPFIAIFSRIAGGSVQEPEFEENEEKGHRVVTGYISYLVREENGAINHIIQWFTDYV